MRLSKVLVSAVILATVGRIRAEGPSSNYLPPGGGRPTAFGGGGGGGGGGSPSGPSGNGGDGGPPEPFSFSYEVKDPESGNDYAHRAESDGYTVKGEYRVLLPDGRNQVVTYTADDGGYNADVQYNGGGNGIGGGTGHGGGTGIGGGNGQGGGAGYPTGAGSHRNGGGTGPGYPTGGGGGGYPSGSPSQSYLPPGK